MVPWFHPNFFLVNLKRDKCVTCLIDKLCWMLLLRATTGLLGQMTFMYTFRRRPGTFDLVTVQKVALTRLASDGRVILGLYIEPWVLCVEVNTPVLEDLLAVAGACLQQDPGRKIPEDAEPSD